MSSREIDQYLAALDEPKRSTLETLRQSILEVVPEAEQCISYGMPTFKIQGKTVAGFAAFKRHLSYLPHSGSVLPALGEDLASYEQTKGSLHFPVDKPLPKRLVKKLVTTRMPATWRRLGVTTGDVVPGVASETHDTRRRPRATWRSEVVVPPPLSTRRPARFRTAPAESIHAPIRTSPCLLRRRRVDDSNFGEVMADPDAEPGGSQPTVADDRLAARRRRVRTQQLHRRQVAEICDVDAACTGPAGTRRQRLREHRPNLDDHPPDRDGSLRHNGSHGPRSRPSRRDVDRRGQLAQRSTLVRALHRRAVHPSPATWESRAARASTAARIQRSLNRASSDPEPPDPHDGIQRGPT